MAVKQLAVGSSQYKIYKTVVFALLFIGIVLVAFAFNDVGQLTLFDNNYNLSLTRISKAIAFIIAILGLQVIVGYTGQVALGQSFFFGLGAYVTAYLVQDQNWGYLTTLAVVVPVCFVIGVLLGLPALRISGLYLALVTLAIAAIFPSIIRLDQLFDYTNGSNGKIVDSDIVAPSWLPLDGTANVLQAIPYFGQFFGDGDLSDREADRIWKYFLFVAVAAVCFWLVANLIQSRPGRAMRAIRDNEASAAVSGIDLARTKSMAFGIGSALGGVGGTVYVMELGIASPDDFTQLLAINFIVGLVVGGVASLPGAVVGGFVIALIPDWASSTQSIGFVPERWLQGPTGTLFLGALLILLTFFLPGGIVAGGQKLKAKFVRLVPQPPENTTTSTAMTSAKVVDDKDDDDVDLDANERANQVQTT